jgi:tripartite-type tricarboxylate transporter receptor subunit TctC
VKTVPDFIAWCKANHGSPGAGGPPHMLQALQYKESGVERQPAPCRGSGPGIQDLLSGRVREPTGQARPISATR